MFTIKKYDAATVGLNLPQGCDKWFEEIPDQYHAAKYAHSDLMATSEKPKIALSFQIMTRAEPVAVVQETIASLLAIKAPEDEILIIDNNHQDKSLYMPLQTYCNRLNKALRVRFYHEDFIAGYKSGALNKALSLMDASCRYIVVVDSDYQALPNARARIIAAIERYPNQALLQFPQHYRDSGKPDVHAELNHYFSYHIRRDFNRNKVLSTGTFAVINRASLLSLGGWSAASLTEDAQMGVLLHRQGESSQFIPEVIATGLLPQTLADLISQRRRWIYGNMQVLLGYRQLWQENDLASVSAENNASVTRQWAYIRAHMSQLSAWVNFTGVFIGLHTLAAASLAWAKLQPTAQPSSTQRQRIALLLLSLSYGSYGLYLTQRLTAYLRDTQALNSATQVSALSPQVAAPTLAASISQSKQSNAKPSKSTGLFSVKKIWRQAKSILRRNVAKAKTVVRDKLTARALNEESLSKNSVDKPITQPIVKANSRLVDTSIASETRFNAQADVISAALSTRLRAWLLHLNFWELGAWSWWPVLWGRQQPFICTPKAALSQSPLKTTLVNLMVLPKFLLLLNLLTAILVRRHSTRLFLAAISLSAIKVAAAAMILTNFSADGLAANS
ncbi:glycosyltransferase family 2 protein [Psychrobacter arenosus]|uniref:glycosyltransferase family 2 protein n=1 Tax=Psychrobacter arenosus TaxID=256326 RepID=UPI001918B0BF|nr:glycosyltransferase family 2 protein [Psychrobacter arenosus]